jgi:nicotinamidase-related amidase
MNKITKVFICGIATESCVMKTAIDLFERNIRPIVIQDACCSHAGEAAHNAGLLIIERNIGKAQITDSSLLDNFFVSVP